MRVRFTKELPAAAGDTLTCVRADGSTTTLVMRRHGVLPRPAVHFVLETTLAWPDALFGPVARGRSLESIRVSLENPLRAKARKDTPAQLAQAAALVEIFQAEQWSGPRTPAAFTTALAQACQRRGVPAPDISSETLARARLALREFGAAWRPLAPGQSLERTFPA